MTARCKRVVLNKVIVEASVRMLSLVVLVLLGTVAARCHESPLPTLAEYARIARELKQWDSVLPDLPTFPFSMTSCRDYQCEFVNDSMHCSDRTFDSVVFRYSLADKGFWLEANELCYKGLLEILHCLREEFATVIVTEPFLSVRVTHASNPIHTTVLGNDL